MGVRLIADPSAETDAVAMYDSVTGLAFGPVFNSEEEAVSFLEALPYDAREMRVDALAERLAKFRERREIADATT
jgi:hypothetical protein